MLRKILLVMNLIFILSMGVVCAAERTYEVTDEIGRASCRERV